MVSQTEGPKSEHTLTTTKTWNPISVTFMQRQHFTLILKMEIQWSSDTMVPTCKIGWCNNPEDNLKYMFSLPFIPLHFVSYIKTVLPIINVCTHTQCSDPALNTASIVRVSKFPYSQWPSYWYPIGTHLKQVTSRHTIPNFACWITVVQFCRVLTMVYDIHKHSSFFLRPLPNVQFKHNLLEGT